MSKLLGLDVSTSCVGVAVLDSQTGSIELLDHIQLSKLKNLWEKGDAVCEYLNMLNNTYDIKIVYIEDAAKKFASGMSSASVIATLMRFNGIASYIAWNILDIEPNYVAPSAARKLCGLTMQQAKKCGKSHKIQTFDAMMSSDLSHLVWPLKLRSKNIVDWAYDEVDAYVVAKAGYLLEQSKPSV